MADQVSLDLGVADVHRGGTERVFGGTPEDRMARRKKRQEARLGKNKGGAKADAKQTPDGRKRIPKSIHVRADLIPGGTLHVRHMSDVLYQNETGTQCVDKYDGAFRMRALRSFKLGDEVDPAALGIVLKGKSTWKDGSTKKLVWVQLAEVGAWKGHGAGAFSLTPATFSEICLNFEKRGLPVPFDMEHASEQDPTSGNIPVLGAPAPGWVHKLDNRGIGGLWGLVEWFDYAREKILEGAFGFLSPAIRFDSKDASSGAPAGAKLTSVAITNQPFLTNLAGLVAAKDAAASVELRSGGLDRMIASPHEYLPQIRQALKVHDLMGPEELSDHLDHLRECCMSSGPTGMHQGVDLSAYTGALRAICGAGPADTWDSVFDRVQDMIDAAVEDHENREHGGVHASMTTSAASAAKTTAGDTGTETETMPTEAELATQLKDVTTKLTTAETKVTTLESSAEALTIQLKDVTGRADKAESTLKDIVSAVSIKDGETIAVAVKRITEDNAKLLKDKADRDEADLKADVDEAFDTYKDKMGLTVEKKPHMLSLARADRAAFNSMYPPVASSERHLLHNKVPPEKRPEDETVDTDSATTLAKVILARDPALTWSQAKDQAIKQLRDKKNKK